MSIIPREIEVKCSFALMNCRKPTIGAGRNIRNSLIIVSVMQIMKAVKNAIIWFFVIDEAKTPIELKFIVHGHNTENKEQS